MVGPVEPEALVRRYYAEAVATVSAAGHGSEWLLHDRLGVLVQCACYLVIAMQWASVLARELDADCNWN
jgi:hypothetical protein